MQSSELEYPLMRRFERLLAYWIKFCAFRMPPSVAVAQVDPNGPVEVVIPEHGAYTGAFMDFGDEEDDVTLETIEDFERDGGQTSGHHRVVQLLGRTKFS